MESNRKSIPLLWMKKSANKLSGLLLMGGDSTRMGTDKSEVKYREKPHAEYCYGLLKDLIPDSYVSVHEGQSCDFTKSIILDAYPSKGPINGILSALSKYPNSSFLVLAVDLPMIKKETIERLINERDSTKVATVYCTKKTGLPEPLIAIWEAEAHVELERYFLLEGKKSLMGFLRKSDVKYILPSDDKELFNANSPEDGQQAKEWLNQ